MSQTPSPLETALDLLVYLPVGVVMAVGEEVPKLTAKGRARLGGQVAAARVVGQFAVAQGRRVVTSQPAAGRPTASNPARAAGTPTPPVPAPPAGAPTRPARTPPGPAGAAARTVPAAASTRAKAAPGPVPTPAPAAARATSRPAPVPGDGSGPDAGSLAIPGYDSLSASQVVPRLAGLTPGELDAVVRYEAGHRGRRTILARATQLQHR